MEAYLHTLRVPSSSGLIGDKLAELEQKQLEWALKASLGQVVIPSMKKEVVEDEDAAMQEVLER